jgi:hypothetical protein
LITVNERLPTLVQEIRMRRLLVIIALAACFSGCEERQPITRAQVVSNAYNYQNRDDLRWGEPVEVLPPAGVDERGRSWWQLRYHPGRDGTPRILLVDGESGWTRRPPPGYAVRSAPPPKVSGEQALAVPAGSHLLVVIPAATVDADARRALEKEVLRLNALGTNTGLTPLFSLRAGRDGRLALIYGWKDDQGIARDERVVDWMTARTPYRELAWEDLASAP